MPVGYHEDFLFDLAPIFDSVGQFSPQMVYNRISNVLDNYLNCLYTEDTVKELLNAIYGACYMFDVQISVFMEDKDTYAYVRPCTWYAAEPLAAFYDYNLNQGTYIIFKDGTMHAFDNVRRKK